VTLQACRISKSKGPRALLRLSPISRTRPRVPFTTDLRSAIVVVPDSTRMRSPMWIDYGRRGRYKGDHASVIMKSNRSILGWSLCDGMQLFSPREIPWPCTRRRRRRRIMRCAQAQRGQKCQPQMWMVELAGRYLPRASHRFP